jgi:hypothetical protein
MCEWEAVVWGCGHGTRRKVKYCHQARNRFYHECYQTGNDLWELNSIDRNGREFEIEDENCEMCIRDGKDRFRHPDEYPEPVLQDSRAQYSLEELNAAGFLNKKTQTNDRSQHRNRFSPLPSQNGYGIQNSQPDSVNQFHTSRRSGSAKQYNRTKIRRRKESKQESDRSNLKKRRNTDAMDLDCIS